MELRQHHGQLALMTAGAATLTAAFILWGKNRRLRRLGRWEECGSNGSNRSAEDDGLGSDQLQQRFRYAANLARSFTDGSLDHRDRLMLYGLYKQALVGDRNVDKPSKLNIVATEKYNAWGKFSGLSRQFAMAKYAEVVQHFSRGGQSIYRNSSHIQGDNSEFVYDDDESLPLDEDGCPINEGMVTDYSLNGLGIRQSQMMGLESEAHTDLDSTADSRLRYASAHSDIIQLQRAIDDGANIDDKDELGQTALHFAADRGNIDCMLLLINAHANVNAVDFDGIGILQTAVSTRNIDAMKILLENGANPDIVDGDGDTSRSLVMVDGNVAMLDLFARFPQVT